jgi:hypothetical protein
MKVDKELKEFQELMQVPSTFDEGFNWTALVGALFIGVLMVPGAMYMGLVAGMGVGPAAQWVTVILFIEVARRAQRQLKGAEIFILFYMAGVAMGQPFRGLLFNQFFVQSEAAMGMGIAEHMAEVPWFAPTDPEVLELRTFFHPAWLPAIGMILFSTIVGRLNGTFLTYGLFRLASDIEKLPFPMAPIGAQGIVALVEQQSEESGDDPKQSGANWRWRVFCIGGMLGLSFGVVYLALPTISAALFGTPITIIPIPFVEWTDKTSHLLPAVAMGLNMNLLQLITGMVLPFWAMVGSFVGLVVTMVANPLLYRTGILHSWEVGDNTIQTLFKNNMDFYFSFTIGVSIALAAAGIWGVVGAIRRRRSERAAADTGHAGAGSSASTIPEGRGDIRARYITAVYLATSLFYILVSGWLIEWHRGVMVVLVFFAFVYTPLISYVTARLEGLAGQVVEIPMVREAAFILSGYTGGVKVWFLPLPYHDYGVGTVFYRQAELTGTRFWSIWKAELLLVPIVVLTSILFAQFIWTLAPIPGPEYPFAEVMWELQAANQSIVYSSTLGRYSAFDEALNFVYLGCGTLFGMLLFAFMTVLSLPIMLTYGVVRGLNQTMPHAVIPQFVGALIGRYYFRKRMGLKWRQYIPVVAAGFSCGMGLITVLAVGINFLAKAVIKIPF